MLLSDLSTPTASADPRRWLAWTRTLRYQQRLDRAAADIDRWLAACSSPVVSCSGGKDSTVLLDLIWSRDPSVLAVRADPPNPLPDRQAHVDRLASVGRWEVVPYPWDVEAVLQGTAPYPAELKQRRLRAWAKAAGVDGVALGIRAAESKQRRMTLAHRGTVYQTAEGWRCAPLAAWSAEEVLGHILRRDLPLNPVYAHLRALPVASMEHLRDGTWWPHGDDAEVAAWRSWLALHYPQIVEDYQRALALRA